MNIMTTKIAKHTILGLALLGLFGCASARAQIALQDGSTNKIISNSGSSSISTNFTVTSGASVLVVSLYDRNNVASESAPASLSWGAQTLTRIAGEYDARSTYATVATYYLYTPTPGAQTITATDTSGSNVIAMAMQVYTLNGVSTTNPPTVFTNNAAYTTNLNVALSGVPAGAWGVVSGCMGYNTEENTYLVPTSGTPGYAQILTGDDVVMGGVANLAAGAGTVSLGNVGAGGVQMALAITVFASSGVNTNFVTPQFSGLPASTIAAYGSPSVALSGTVSTNGHYLPAGTAITVSVNGGAQQTTVDDGTGDFTINYSTVGIPASGTPYPVTYTSAANDFFFAATNTGTTLTINPLPVVLNGYLLYNGATTVPASNLSVANLVGTDNLTLSGSVTVAGTNAGPEAITSFGGLTLGGTAAPNYTLTGASGTVTMITTGGILKAGVTNWLGIFTSPASIAGWADHGGSGSPVLSFVAGDAPPWGPSTGALLASTPVTTSGIYAYIGTSFSSLNLTNCTQVEFDVKVGTNQTEWTIYNTACNNLIPIFLYGSSSSDSGPQPPVYPAAAYNGWQHFVIPLTSFSSIADLSQTVGFQFEFVSAAFNASGTMALEFANVEADGPPVATSPAITLNPSNVVRTADARWFGINTGGYDYDFTLQHTVPEAQEAGWTTFRYPGGNGADTWHWYQWLTPGSQNNDLPNFCQVVTNLGAQAVIGVNYGTGTPQEAASLVAYLNVTNHLGFKYFEVGNEVYAYPTEVDSNSPGHDPWEYGMRSATYITQMKAVDPTIKVGVFVLPGETIDPGTNVPHFATNLLTGQVVSGWTPVVMSMLRQAGVAPDFVIYHCYPENGGDNDQTLMATANWAGDAAELRGEVNDFFGPSGTNIELLITENNSEAGNPGKQSVSLVNALYYADSLGQIAQTEFNCRMWWQLRDGEPPYTDGDLTNTLYGWRMYGAFGLVNWADGAAVQYTNRYPPFFAAELVHHFITAGDTVISAPERPVAGVLLCGLAHQRQSFA